MQKLKLAAVATLAAMTASGPALAATATANMNVKITITDECKVTTPTDLDFGSRGVLDANFDATATFSVTCTNAKAYTIGFGTGNGSGASTTTRKMTGGAATVDYKLFKEAARTNNWGNAAAELVSATGTGAAQPYTVYGRVPPQTTPAAGNYTDIVAVTITY